MKKQDKARKALSRTLDQQRFELVYGYRSKTVTECSKRK